MLSTRQPTHVRLPTLQPLPLAQLVPHLKQHLVPAPNGALCGIDDGTDLLGRLWTAPQVGRKVQQRPDDRQRRPAVDQPERLARDKHVQARPLETGERRQAEVGDEPGEHLGDHPRL